MQNSAVNKKNKILATYSLTWLLAKRFSNGQRCSRKIIKRGYSNHIFFVACNDSQLIFKRSVAYGHNVHLNPLFPQQFHGKFQG